MEGVGEVASALLHLRDGVIRLSVTIHAGLGLELDALGLAHSGVLREKVPVVLGKDELLAVDCPAVAGNQSFAEEVVFADILCELSCFVESSLQASGIRRFGTDDFDEFLTTSWVSHELG